MDGVEIDPANGVAVMGPGARLEELNVELARHGLFFPVDPGSVKSATVGRRICRVRRAENPYQKSKKEVLNLLCIFAYVSCTSRL